MKKLFGKALAMAVMMSVFAGGSAYAVNPSKAILAGTVDTWSDAALSGFHVNNYTSEYVLDQHASLYADDLNFYDKDSNKIAKYGSDSMMLGSIQLDTTNGLDMGGLTISNIAAGTKATDAVNKKQKEDAIAAIGTATYDDTAIKADIAKKADKATTLAGYGITDGATKTELDAKADKTDLDKKADKTDLDAKADKADVEKNAADIADHETRIATLEAGGSGGASTEALEKLDSKINATDARMDRVGATAAALAAINYQPMTKGQSQVAIGMGGYNGKKATAIGMAYQISDRVSGSVAGAANGSERMFNVGFNYLFGQHTAKDIAPMAASNSVSLKEAELQAQVDSMKNEIAELKAMVKALAAK